MAGVPDSGYQVSPSRHACRPHPSPGVSSFWRCLPCLVTVQGRRRQFRYLYALNPQKRRRGNRRVPGEPVAGSRSAARRGFRTARPAPGARPVQPSAAQRDPLPPRTELSGLPAPGPTHRSLGGGPRTGHWRAAGLAGDSGAHGAHAAGAVYTRDPVPPPGARWRRPARRATPSGPAPSPDRQLLWPRPFPGAAT